MRYAVYEEYIPRLSAKIAKIRNKCEKYGCDFRCDVVGEEYREVMDRFNKPVTARFVIVEAEGTAIVNGWELIASVEHTEKGNIFSKTLWDVEIPERYRNSEPVCEHCNTNRSRKYLYIIRNTETGEFKQIGKSCLMDYTHGLSAEVAAHMASLRDVFEEASEYYPPSGDFRTYVKTEEILSYAAEVVKHYGYVRSNPAELSTRDRTEDFYRVAVGKTNFLPDDDVRRIRKEIKRIGFNAENSLDVARKAIEWIKTQDASNDYIHNLQVAAGLEYTHFGRLGLLVSLIPTYMKTLERSHAKSKWIGNIGERIEVDVDTADCVTSWENCFDGYHTTTTYLFKFTDADGNVFMWKTQKAVEKASKLIGTVKEHSEYKGEKQTILTRCRCE